MKKYKLIILLLLMALNYGCASSVQYVPGIEYNADSNNCPADKSCIFIIRPASFVGSALHFVVSDNKNAIGVTGPSSYLAWQRDPGDVTIESIAENTVEFHFKAQAGQTYYILQSVQPGIISGRNTLDFISKDKADEYLSTCHPAGKESE